MPKFMRRVTRDETIEFDALRLSVEPRYLDEDCPDFPKKFIVGGKLHFIIDLKPDGAFIRGWKGKSQELHTKCTDCCDTFLLNGDKVVAKKEMDVPGFMPGDHYGEYLILDIDDAGKITNWKERPNYAEAFDESK